MPRFRIRAPSPPKWLQPFLILTRHFFRRFFLNEEVGFEEEVKLKMAAAGALVAVLVGSAANSILFKYMFIPDTGQSWLEKGTILTLLMALTAFLVVIEWDVLFLGRQDYQNLMPLPIGPRTLFGAKLASFLILVASFTLIANALAVFVFAIYLPQWHPHSWAFSFRLFFVHLLSVLAADVFMFLACLIGILMVVLSAGLFRLVSLALRFLLLVFFVVFGLSLVSDGLGDPRLFESLNGVVQGRSALVFYVPSLWYTGLYERLLGNPDPAFASLADLGVFALAAALGMFTLVFAAGYRRQAGRSQEVGVHRFSFPAIRSGAARAFGSIVLRHPVERAVFVFFERTLTRSPRHKWRAAAIMSVPAGLALLLGSWGRVRLEAGAAPAGALLGVPVTAALFLLIGARALAASPATPEANWIFRLTEHPGHRPYFVGVKKAVFWLGLVPLFLAVLALSWPLWGLRNAFLHALFGLSLSALLEQVLFFRFAKIPFACASLPGRERLQFLWFVYLGGFLIFVSLMIRLETGLFRNPAGFAVYFSILAVLLLASGVANRTYFYSRTGLVYEEAPEPAFVSLKAPS